MIVDRYIFYLCNWDAHQKEEKGQAKKVTSTHAHTMLRVSKRGLFFIYILLGYSFMY